MDARTSLAIGVGQVPRGTGTCTFFSLAASAFFAANKFTSIPMTVEVINHLNLLAAEDTSKITADAPFYIGDTLISDTLPASGDPLSAADIVTAPHTEPDRAPSGHKGEEANTEERTEV